MNKKGEAVSSQVGMVIIIAVTLIVGVVLFQVIAQEVGDSTSTTAIENVSLTAAAVDGTAQYLTGLRSIADVNIFNATNDIEVPDDNYTVANNVIHPTTGDLTVSVTPAASGDGFDVGVWTIDGTAQPVTYIADSGGRAMAGLITIFFALAIAVVALTPTLRSNLLSAMGK